MALDSNLEKSNNSSTMFPNLSASAQIILKPIFKSSFSSASNSKVSPHPFIDVNGVLNSCEIEEIKSFLIFSDFVISEAK